MVQESGLLERLLRTMFARPALEAIAFTDAGPHGHFPHRLLAPTRYELQRMRCSGEVTAQRKLPDALKLTEGLEVESLARVVSNEIALQWRHAAVAGISCGSPHAWLRVMSIPAVPG